MNSKRIMFTLILCMLPVFLLAGDQNEEKKYQIGGRSALITGDMKLSQIDPAFNDLSPDGFKGAHHSGVYFLYRYRPYLRIGFETLAGNSDSKNETTMNFQAAGPVVQFVYGEKFFLLGGLHAGAIIMNALHRSDDASDNKVQSGRHYKNSGYFAAPFIGVGLKRKSQEYNLFVKFTANFSSDSKTNIDAFNALYAGISYGYNF